MAPNARDNNRSLQLSSQKLQGTLIAHRPDTLYPNHIKIQSMLTRKIHIGKLNSRSYIKFLKFLWFST